MYQPQIASGDPSKFLLLSPFKFQINEKINSINLTRTDKRNLLIELFYSSLFIGFIIYTRFYEAEKVGIH